MGEVDYLLTIPQHVDFHFEAVELLVDTRLAVENSVSSLFYRKP